MDLRPEKFSIKENSALLYLRKEKHFTTRVYL
jgi:hypothetical protein